MKPNLTGAPRPRPRLRQAARWQQSALLFSLLSLVTFLINLAFTVWAVNRQSRSARRRSNRTGVGVLADGLSCAQAENISTGAHVAINALSTVLLAGSNYCMQCLAAPTREQVDRAHRGSRWVEIGVPSVRNVFFGAVSRGNRLLWGLLLLSSLPLHLFYNSAIFTSISTNEYTVTVVNTPFLTTPDRSQVPSYLRSDYLDAMYLAYTQNRLDHLDRDACLDAYAANFQSTRGDLLIVATPQGQESESNPFPPPDKRGDLGVQHGAQYALNAMGCGIRQSFQWICDAGRTGFLICGAPCEDDLPAIRADPGANWNVWGFRVKECYSVPTEERCQLSFSPPLCWAMTGLNLLKAVLMLVTALRGRGGGSAPMLTVGDAVASFMAVPDECTTDMCLASKKTIARSRGLWSREPRLVKSAEFRRRRKFAAASRRRWFFSFLLYTICIVGLLALFTWGRGQIPGAHDLRTLLSLGLGTLSSKTLIQSGVMGSQWNWLLANVIMANSPQLVMSLTYFTYNSLFTSLSLATEWDSFARNAKGLRVSARPEGSQRSTHFLQLPYRYSVPLLVVSGVLHWLISQSIFLVSVEVYAGAGSKRVGEMEHVRSYATCAWSPAGMLAVIVIALLMVCVVVVLGWRRLGFGIMPIAGSCSAAISAACHPPELWRDELAPACFQPLQWGVTSVDADGVAHCSFSAGRVEEPRPGVKYS